MALQLRRHGITRVRPLAGGLDAWIAAGHPVVELPDARAPAAIAG